MPVTVDGGPAFLKCFKPNSDEHRSSELLAWYGGEGAARVLRMDPSAVLLERIPGESLSELVRAGCDQQATQILANVVSLLHAERPDPLPPLLPLSERFAPLFALGNSTDNVASQISTLAAHLLETTQRDIPLHGDIHHDNILHHPDRGWLAIDPKGLVGDPHYDLANTFLNPINMQTWVQNPKRVQALVETLAVELDLDRKRLLQFALCHARLSALWSEADGEDPGHALSMVSTISGVLLAF